MIKSIIFDFDGTMMDTETVWYEAYKKAFKTYEVALLLEEWGKCIGTSFDVYNPMDFLEKELGRSVDRNIVSLEANDYFSEHIKTQGLRPGVRDYLDSSRDLGYAIALATSSNRKWIDTYLTKFDLHEYFDVIVTSDDVTNVKPDPEIYLKALLQLAVKGYEALSFEDSLNGINAAKAAGIHCVVVPNQVTSFMNFVNYDLKISSMEEYPLKVIIQKINDL